ncbi:ABC transporter, ATPase, predicted [Ammonifex degensii KC4]|uniref:ABC transporter, ATPase, predicted n=1 Tax=Ammonifex degensii (strain DSM 10501 / KC4) TaxID=429009 RepID=C9R9E1_AMMDK|nr:ABC-ATPase domain-containing protein [Ammonifex degensii]ACX52920.1 ABC transporter, ATPase, predicted [Ammonifex degensii KC4]
MKTKEEFREKLRRIDGRGYKAYQELEGAYRWDDFFLFLDHAQSDPFAPPSKVRVRVEQGVAGFPMELITSKPARVALCDFLTRVFGRYCRALSRPCGTGHSGEIHITPCGQEILERTAVVVNEKFVEARIAVGLPARGRTITAREAQRIFFEVLPEIVRRSLRYANLDKEALWLHVHTAEDQDSLRRQMKERGLVAFVADGSILPRESGASDRPLPKDKAIPFQSPPELRVSFTLPHRGIVTGMGIPRGVTLIVGGGYHGKTTLLRAIERGVYDHIPGDGREFVLTVRDAVKIRAEDGRAVTGVDISSFITNLPGGQDTRFFSTPTASGSTSQAANIAEALEVGTSLLLLDEDTSATNFMIRDARMQALVAKDKEPITPFIDRVRQLYQDYGVSTILVVGGSGDYFDVADHVIMMENYRPRLVTAAAREIAQAMPTRRNPEEAGPFKPPIPRILLPDPWRLGPRDKVKAQGLSEIRFGRETIDLSAVEQLVDPAQTRAIAVILRRLPLYADGKRTLREILELLEEEVEREGLDVLAGRQGEHPGEMARPRRHEIAAAINRYRRLAVRPAR